MSLWATYPNVFEWSIVTDNKVVCGAALNDAGTGIQIMIWPGGLKPGQAEAIVKAAEAECAKTALLFEPVFGTVSAELERRGRAPKQQKGFGKGGAHK